MGVFGAVFGRRGVAGFRGPVLGASRGVIGIKVAMFLRPVREVFRARRCAGLGCSTAREAGCGGGFALHEAFQGCVAGVSEPHVVQFPPFGGQAMRALRKLGASCRAIPPVRRRRGRHSQRRGAQSADHLGEKRRKWGVVGEVDYVLGTQVPGTVRMLARELIIRTADPRDCTDTR